MAIREISYGVIPVRKRGDRWIIYLVKHASGHWGMPKGRKEEDESIHDCAARELREETQLEVEKWLMVLPYFQEYTFERDGELIEKEVTYCLATVKGQAKVDRQEVIEGRWFSFEKAQSTLTYDKCKEIVAKVEKALAGIERLGW